jgi:hypothetical protein
VFIETCDDWLVPDIGGEPTNLGAESRSHEALADVGLEDEMDRLAHAALDAR